MTEQQTARAPIEDVLLFTAQQLTDNAYERFSQGEVSQSELKKFYEILTGWTAASEKVLEEMNKLGIT